MTRSLFALLLLTASVLPAQALPQIWVSDPQSPEARSDIDGVAQFEIGIAGNKDHWAVVCAFVSVPKATGPQDTMNLYIEATYPYLVQQSTTDPIPANLRTYIEQRIEATATGGAAGVELCQNYDHNSPGPLWLQEAEKDPGFFASLWNTAPEHWTTGIPDPYVNWSATGEAQPENSTVINGEALARQLIAWQATIALGPEYSPESYLVDEALGKMRSAGLQIHFQVMSFAAESPNPPLPNPVALPPGTPPTHPILVGTSHPIRVSLLSGGAGPEDGFPRFDIGNWNPNVPPATPRPWWYAGSSGALLRIELAPNQTFNPATMAIALPSPTPPYYTTATATLREEAGPMGGQLWAATFSGALSTGIGALGYFDGPAFVFLDVMTPDSGLYINYFQFINVVP